MKITYRAPAKVILSGEHAVVYGKPALLTAVQKYITISLTTSDSTPSVVADSKVVPSSTSVTAATRVPAFVTEALTYPRKQYPMTADRTQKFSISVTSEIPVGAGLGSSAALHVALSAVLGHYLTGSPLSKDEINRHAYHLEKKSHARPSGADNSVSCFGGLVFYRKEFEFLKTISALHMKLPVGISSRLLLIQSGTPKESTSEMVKHVSQQYNSRPDEIEKVLSGIEKCTKRMVVALSKEDQSLFADAIATNQELLDELGIVGNTARTLLKDLKDEGAGKITGAGGLRSGSGYLLFLSKNLTSTTERLTAMGLNFFSFHSDTDGVKEVVL